MQHIINQNSIEKSLKLTEKQTLPSREALRQYGNTSSSSIWYEMDFIRHNQGLKRGQRILQVTHHQSVYCYYYYSYCCQHCYYMQASV
jgi:predicted naringenin-chalcone synthase